MNSVDLEHLEAEKIQKLEKMGFKKSELVIPEVLEEEKERLGKELFDLVKDLAHKNRLLKDMTTQQRAVNTSINKKIEELIAKGADVNYQEQEQGMTPLIICCSNGLFDTFKLLVNSGADINKSSYYGTTPVIFSVINGEIRILNALILLGADINAQCLDGDTALMVAQENIKVNSFVMLKEAGANFKTMDAFNRTVFDRNHSYTTFDYSGISPFPTQEKPKKVNISDRETKALSEAKEKLSSVCHDLLESGLVVDRKEASDSENNVEATSKSKVKTLNL